MSDSSATASSRPSSSKNRQHKTPWVGKVVCKFYSEGKYCPHKLCHFLHESKPEEREDVAATDRKPCHYFRAGYCKKGSACQFKHAKSQCKEEETTGSNKSCHYFAAGHCKKGSECKFKHAEVQPHKKQGPAVKRITAEMTKIHLSKASDAELSRLRDREIGQLQKPFPIQRTLYSVEKGDSYRFIFSPTDPDWPYDVKELSLIVTFPARYPIEMMELKLANDDDDGVTLPDTVRSYVESSMDSWLREKEKIQERSQQTQLLFRPFLKWLDKSLEKIFTKGLIEYKKELIAKAAGLEFLHPDQLKKKAAAAAKSTIIPDEDVDEEDESDDDDDDDSVHHSTADDSSNDDTTAQTVSTFDIAPTKRGTEVRLTNLALSETVATLQVDRITIMLRCARCQQHLPLTTPPSRLNSFNCDRCHTSCQLMLRSAVMHGFSSVLGYLDLDACTPFDMVLADSHFTVTCLDCTHQEKLKALPAGQPMTIWCQQCHQKLVLAVNSVRFLQLQPSTVAEKESVHVDIKSTKPRNVKDASIVLGTPLPKNGTCKHYSKSFRWMRFPCCGKLYPCDLCHEEKEHDHEMKYANRIVCGFCSKEQPSNKDNVCAVCNAATTKRSSAFWEGGKGCRNRTKMSRSDDKKFADMNKTVSRHAKEQQKSGKQKAKK